MARTTTGTYCDVCNKNDVDMINFRTLGASIDICKDCIDTVYPREDIIIYKEKEKEEEEMTDIKRFD